MSVDSCFTDQWLDHFNAVVEVFSKGEFEEEILAAKKEFFSKIGHSHEWKEGLFESSSLCFQEYYIFNRPLRNRAKPPAIVFVEMEMGEDSTRQWLQKNLFHAWSLFEVLKIEKDQVLVYDLLWQRPCRLLRSYSPSLFQSWRAEKNQIVQARLFEAESGCFYMTHFWLHPETERELLKKICDRQKQHWSMHEEFLFSCQESLLRSLAISDQIRAAEIKNFFYQELNRYARAS